MLVNAVALDCDMFYSLAAGRISGYNTVYLFWHSTYFVIVEIRQTQSRRSCRSLEVSRCRDEVSAGSADFPELGSKSVSVQN